MPSNDLKWFAFLCVENGIADEALCRQICRALGDNVDILLFAETLIANDVCTDNQRLQELINQAWASAQNGEPPPRDVVSDAPVQMKAEPTGPTITPSDTVLNLRKKTADGEDESTEELNIRPLIQEQVARGIEMRPEQEGDIQKHPKKLPPQSPPDPTRSVPVSNEPQKKLRPQAPLQPQTPVGAQPTAPEPPQATEREQPIVQTKARVRPTASTFGLGVDLSQARNVAIDFNTIGQMSTDQLKLVMVRLLMSTQEMGASDLHLSADARPFVRLNCEMKYLSDRVLTAEESMALNTALLSPSQNTYFREKQDFDFALALDSANRYRVNLMIHKDGAGGTYRMIPNRIQTLEELGFTNADTIRSLLDYHNGLILVTGPVGSGKTTTMAAMVAELNAKRSDHIITVENPIEIVHHAIACNVTQREVGTHTDSFHAALKGALREDPDIIVIGELRDLETIEMAITAAETGHLVIGTLHTANAATTLNRLLDVFPPSQQPQIRAMTAESLRGIVCQRLVPSAEGNLVVACELLLNNLAVSNLIREGKAHALRAVLETGSKQGMCMMDHYLLGLWQAGTISEEIAQTYIQDRAVRNRIKSHQQFGDAAAQAVQTSLPGQKDAKKKWGLFS